MVEKIAEWVHVPVGTTGAKRAWTHRKAVVVAEYDAG